MVSYKFCYLEPIAYVGDKQVGWICTKCGGVYHDSVYYLIKKGVTDYLTGSLEWQRVIGL